MTTWHSQQCSDPRDKVFALFGLLRICTSQHFIAIDYDIAVEDFCKKVLDETVFFSTEILRDFYIILQQSLDAYPCNDTVRSAIKSTQVHVNGNAPEFRWKSFRMSIRRNATGANGKCPCEGNCKGVQTQKENSKQSQANR